MYNYNYDISLSLLFLILPLPRICYLLVCNLEFWGYLIHLYCFFIVVILRHVHLNYDKLVPPPQNAAMPSLILQAREKTDPQTCKPHKHEYRSSRSRNSCVLFLENHSGRDQNFASAPTLIVRDNWCEMPSFPIPVTCLYYL